MLDVPIILITFIVLIPEIAKGGIAILLPLAIATVASLMMTTAVYTAVASFGIITTEVDHLIWVFRDVSQMARFPVEIYGSIAKTILTYLLPVGIIYTLPAETLMGLTNVKTAMASLLVAGIFLVASMGYWRYALKRYSSGGS
jgi:ABC-2 type transport system permease protein